MKIEKGSGKSEFGPGVNISLSGDDVARAIMSYLTAKGVHIDGPRTIRVNGELCEEGEIYIDPSGFCIDENGKKWDGRG